MMKYSGKPKHRTPWKVITIVVIFVLLSLIGFLFPNFLRRINTNLARPVWFIRDRALSSLSFASNFFKLKSTLVNANMALEDQIAFLKLKEIDYDTLVIENQNLKAHFGRTTSSNRILAFVLSKPPQSPYDTLVLDVGSEDGIAVSDKVYLSESILIGAITSTTEHSSIATLFSGSGNKQTSILQRTGTLFELYGKGGGNLELQVPKDTDILWGDVFLYPGLSASVLGSVYYIDTNSQSSFKTIYLRIPGNVFSSRFVFIQKGG